MGIIEFIIGVFIGFVTLYFILTLILMIISFGAYNPTGR
jgi:hypothetical protein